MCGDIGQQRDKYVSSASSSSLVNGPSFSLISAGFQQGCIISRSSQIPRFISNQRNGSFCIDMTLM